MNVKRTRKGPAPLMGRQLFRGQYTPLILANNTGVSPDVYGAVYEKALEVIPNVDKVAPGLDEPCTLSRKEEAWCEYNPDLPLCRKRKLKYADPECAKLSGAEWEPECEITSLLKQVCNAPYVANDPLNYLRDFCKLKKIDGMCIDEGKKQYDKKPKCARLYYKEDYKPSGIKAGDLWKDFCPLTDEGKKIIEFHPNMRVEYYTPPNS